MLLTAEENYWEAEVCGRPLGMRFDNKGKLIVADAYLGIFRVNVDTGNCPSNFPS